MLTTLATQIISGMGLSCRQKPYDENAVLDIDLCWMALDIIHSASPVVRTFWMREPEAKFVELIIVINHNIDLSV